MEHILETTFPFTSAIVSDVVRCGSDVVWSVWTWFGCGSEVGRRWLGRVFSELVQTLWQKLRESGFQHPVPKEVIQPNVFEVS